jgi:hypothetical protein
MKTFTATKNGETLKYITAKGESSSEAMKNIRSACMFLESEPMAVSAETSEGWMVERAK